MVDTKNKRFDPAAHLTKQGWKGKGTGQCCYPQLWLTSLGIQLTRLALKDGHATRHIATVKKNTLSGIGKDRDQAIPFWDQ
jgi:nucleolar protein TMA23